MRKAFFCCPTLIVRSVLGPLLMIMVSAVIAHAQEATLLGKVIDASGAVMPGATVHAVQTETGNSFEAVADERGSYRISLRVGPYRVTAELSGFTPLTRNITLLLGQEGVLDFQMIVSGVSESLTVTAQTPLIETVQSAVGGHVDPVQAQALPLNGRNWMELVLLAPGARGNAIDTTASAGPDVTGGTQGNGDYQVNLDGQQVTQLLSVAAGAGPPRFSRDAIAEFELKSGRFDATQGRALGLEVNVVTKSGSNTFLGSAQGYFRDQDWNAPDPVVHKVLPYQDQQGVGTFGGPIKEDRIHFFAYYEGERNPQTAVYSTPYPIFNGDITSTNVTNMAGGRLDAEFSPRTRLTLRAATFGFNAPVSGSGSSTSAITTATGMTQDQVQLLAILSHVMSDQTVNELRGGWSYLDSNSAPASLCRIPNADSPRGCGGPTINLKGLTVGGGGLGGDSSQKVSSIRDDVTRVSGAQTLKLGGEFLYYQGETIGFGAGDNGTLAAQNGPIPANIASLFPNIYNPSTWNLAPLSSISTTYTQGFGNYTAFAPKQVYAAWLQDDLTIGPRLTLNLGLRYDFEHNAFANFAVLEPFMPPGRGDDRKEFGPRTGFVFRKSDQTVIRGGYGLYFGTVQNGYFTVLPTQTINPVIYNTGQANFAGNPWGGPTPSYQQIQSNVCTPQMLAGCYVQNTTQAFYSQGDSMPYSHQASIGFERQIAQTMSVQADYVYQGGRSLLTPYGPNENVTFNPATGLNYPADIAADRVWPWWGTVYPRLTDSRSNYHALRTGLTKRLSQRWELSATYTLSGLWDAYPPAYSGMTPVPFPTSPAIGGEYSLGIGDERHRATTSAIWNLPYGLQLTGLYFFGSGLRFATSWGTDVLDLGQAVVGGGTSASLENRVTPTGAIVPRNDFVGLPVQRVDLRLQKRFALGRTAILGGRGTIDGMLECFNLFNHANYGSYVTTEDSVSYGQPQQSQLLAYGPRMLQLGFRLAF
jgi:Carboxypeptidase regulatory-like domain/TonB dependent receptor